MTHPTRTPSAPGRSFAWKPVSRGAATSPPTDIDASGILEEWLTLPASWPLVALLGLLGLRIFEACGANIADLGDEHGHRVLKVRGKGDKTVLAPLPPAVARAIEDATQGRDHGPICATRSVGGWTGTPLPAGATRLL